MTYIRSLPPRLQDALPRVASMLAPWLAAGLYLLMLVQARGFASALIGVVFVAALLAVVAGQRRVSWMTLVGAALALVACVNTFVVRGSLSFDLVDHALMLTAFVLAAIEVLGRTRLELPGWMAPAGIALGAAAAAAYLVYSLALIDHVDGVNPANLSYIGHLFAKGLMLLVPALWLLAGHWAQRAGLPVALVLVLPIGLAVVSPSQSLSLGVALGMAGALVSFRPWIAALAALAVLGVPVAAVAVVWIDGGLLPVLPTTWLIRVELWSEALRFFAERPLLGWGFQSFLPMSETLMQLRAPNHPHSATIELLLDLGILGCLPLVALAWAVGRIVAWWQANFGGSSLRSRFFVLPPLLAWLFVAAVSFELWSDFILAGTAFMLALAAARFARMPA